MNVGEQLQKGHILKFVHNGRTFNPNVGIKTFPKQTYGVSQQSPEQFQQQYTLLGDYGYIYKYQDAKQFEYPSQRSYFDVHHCLEKGDPRATAARVQENSVAFHRKKGRLSQFMDKNGWMSPVMPLMGFERTEDARNLSNRDRTNRISSLKPRIAYENPAEVKTKVNQAYFSTISGLMSQKLRIRKKRQDLVKGQVPAMPRVIGQKQAQADPIHLQNVEERMAKTTKDFYSTSSTFYNSREASNLKHRQISSRAGNFYSRQINRQSSLQSSNPHTNRQNSPEANYRTISPSKVSRTAQLKKIVEDDIMATQELKLQDWYRKSCHSRWDFRPKKVDSEEQAEGELA